MKRNIFVVGLDPFSLAQLHTIQNAQDYNFLPLFTADQLIGRNQIPVSMILDEGKAQLDAFEGSIDGIISYWDFPVSTTLPLLREHCQLPTPSLESVLKCEHKYWSRVEQQACIPEHIPCFQAVNPFAEKPLASLSLDYPFWLKPVKSVQSHLGFKINKEADFHHAIDQIRLRIQRYADPFNLILEQANMPDDIAQIDGYHCIAESIISAGHQCTQEGYVYHGEVVVYGTIDSIREGKHGSSLASYQYPSSLPTEVIDRMTEISARVLRHVGFDNSPFNIEYFWDPQTDQINLLEINTRSSKSHSPLFEKVDGASHHQVAVRLTQGLDPHFPHRQGKHAIAAKYMLRRHQDGRVISIPGKEDIARVHALFPDANLEIEVQPGTRLSELHDQESYSYEIAVLFLGAPNQRELKQRYRRCQELLPFEFAP